MKKNLKRFLAFALTVSASLSLFACKKDDDKTVDKYTPAQKETHADVTAPTIRPDYAYKIVMKDVAFSVPSVAYSENNVTASYTLYYTENGEEKSKEVAVGESITPTQTGKMKLHIKAQDASGNKSQKDILYTVTDDINDLNKIYAFDDSYGLAMHAGATANSTQMLRVVHFDASNPAYTRPTDNYGVDIPNIPAEVTETGAEIDSFVYISNYATVGRMILTNPLHYNWNEKFDYMYYYFYNGGKAQAQVTFNNFVKAVPAGGGWVKVIIAPMEKDGKIYTDYSKISAEGENIGGYNGMIDLADCVGSFLKIASGDKPAGWGTDALSFEHYAMSAIYGGNYEDAQV